jgi:hypothetical protein
MFALDSFSGAPISGYFEFTPGTTLSGLQATALVNSIDAFPQIVVVITADGLIATTLLNSGSSTTTFPKLWTLIITDQYRSS